MSTVYLGQIMMFAGTFAPEGFLFCQGQSLSISSYQELFALLGTTYGGDGQSTFNLPDLRGRVPIHVNSTTQLGTSGGQEQVTLTTAQLPVHTHSAATTGASGTTNTPSSSTILADQGSGSGFFVYTPPASTSQAQFGPSVGNSGNGQSHPNVQPYLAINYCIATEGIYPVAG